MFNYWRKKLILVFQSMRIRWNKVYLKLNPSKDIFIDSQQVYPKHFWVLKITDIKWSFLNRYYVKPFKIKTHYIQQNNIAVTAVTITWFYWKSMVLLKTIVNFQVVRFSLETTWEIWKILKQNTLFPTTVAENLVPLGYWFSSES